jgi:cellulose synthase (UDP-forming)
VKILPGGGRVLDELRDPTPLRLPERVARNGHYTEVEEWGAPRRVRLLVLVNFAAAAFYVSWWLTPGHVGKTALFAMLAGAEVFNLFHLVGFWSAVWSTSVEPPPRRRTAFSVDVFITTYGEPLDILERTVEAAVAMDGEHETYVLDDAGRPEVAELAEMLGAQYIARGWRRGAKAGNLNNALWQTSGELFVILDADHVPHRDFLRRTLGYFEEQDVAFVQTPQFYVNGASNDVARGAYDQQAIFYGPICRGKNGLESAFCCGTNVVFRRKAIEDVGGFDMKSVVEDFVTSIRIHRRGWRSVYYPYVLAEGLGPDGLRTYFRQQFRWARGSIGALVSLEPFRRGLTLGQRFQYFLATTFYLTGIVTTIYLILPLIYLFGGQSAFSVNSGNFVFFYAPYLTLGLLTIRWGLGGQLRLGHLRYTFGAFPVYAVAAVAALLHIPARFRVTEKRGGSTRPPFLAWVSVAVFFATAAAIAYGAASQPADSRTVTNISWGCVNMLLLSGIVGITLREAFARKPATSRRALRASAALAVDAPPELLVHERQLVLPEYALGAPVPIVRRALAPQRRALLEVAALTVFGLILRLVFINTPSLRLDESLSVAQARFGLVDLWDYLITKNVHVPLYHTLLHFWIEVAGESEWAIRMPSVLFGTACIPLLYVVGKRIIGERAAVFAAAIGAASPFWVWHSDEARMYPLLLMLTLAATVLLYNAVDKGGFWRWTAYAITLGITLYSHYFGLLIIPVHLAYLLAYRVGRRKILTWVGLIGGAAAIFSPWIAALIALRLKSGGLESLTSGVRTPHQDYTVFGVVYAFLIFFIVYLVGYYGAGLLAVLSGAVVGVWPIASVMVATSRRFFVWIRSAAAAFIFSWIILTVGLVYVLNIWKDGLWFQKYLIIASPPIFFLLALGLSSMFTKRLVGLALVLVSFTFATAVENYDKTNPVREDFRSAAKVLEARTRPGDVIVVIPRFNVTPLLYYMPERRTMVGVLDPEQTAELTIDWVMPRVAAANRGHSMWVLMLYERTYDREGGVPLYLDRTFLRTATYKFGTNLRLRRYWIPKSFFVPGITDTRESITRGRT